MVYRWYRSPTAGSLMKLHIVVFIIYILIVNKYNMHYFIEYTFDIYVLHGSDNKGCTIGLLGTGVAGANIAYHGISNNWCKPKSFSGFSEDIHF